jgi:hypothetical protein
MQQLMTIEALAGEAGWAGARLSWPEAAGAPVISWQAMGAGLAQAPLAPSVSMAKTPNRAMMRDRPRTPAN